jgi:hypothetical protein
MVTCEQLPKVDIFGTCESYIKIGRGQTCYGPDVPSTKEQDYVRLVKATAYVLFS